MAAAAKELPRETNDAVRLARDKLASLAQRAAIIDDPMAPYLEALSTTVGVLPAFVDHLDRARAPIDAALIERIAEEAATEIPFVLRQQVSSFIKHETRQLVLRATVICFGIAVGAFCAGMAADYFYRPSLAAQVCRAGAKQIDLKTQRPVCSVSVWAD